MLRPPRRFAIHGRMFSGKSTIARLLDEEHGFLWANYTDYGKTIMARALSAMFGRHVSQAEVIRRKNELRPFLIEGLRVYGFDEGNGVDDMLKMLDLSPETEVIFDNVRYLAQYEKLKPYGFRLVRLVISDEEQERRAADAGMHYDELVRLRDEPSEQPVPVQHGEIALYCDGRTPQNILLELFAQDAVATIVEQHGYNALAS